MPATKNVSETIQQAHDRIRKAAIAHFAGKPHGTNDRLEWIRKKMAAFRGIPYVPPKVPPPPVAVAAPEDGSLPLGVMTEALDTDEEL